MVTLLRGPKNQWLRSKGLGPRSAGEFFNGVRRLIDTLIAIRRNQSLAALLVLLFGLIVAYVLAGWIVSDLQYVLFFLFAVGAGVVFVLILKNWRSGFYIFIAWLLFEDLIRKYMGNNMVIYFAKDALVGISYLFFFLALRRNKVSTFKPSFWLPLVVFFWFGVIQLFNPASPNLVYGLLGLKVYFYYVPLMFVGYALVDEEKDLRKFLIFNLCLAVVIAVLGIIQSIRGPEFLNPQDLEFNIRDLATLKRSAPISHAQIYRPTSVFVSEGRFSWYLVLMWLIGFGAAGYLFLRTKRGVNLTLLSLVVLTVALALHGSRGGIMWTGGSALVAIAAFLWGAPWKKREGLRIVRAIRNTCLTCGVGLILMILLFPEALGARWAIYSETLLPDSPAFEVSHRVGDYPMRNFLLAFDTPRWPYGYGIGTASLGSQYVAQWTGTPATMITVESGFGTLVIELGILGLVLWFVWTISLLIAAFRVVRRLKGTAYFPIAFSIFWIAFLLLLPFTYASMTVYQNFVFNAYLWLLVGILFKIPHLAARQTPGQVRLEFDR